MMSTPRLPLLLALCVPAWLWVGCAQDGEASTAPVAPADAPATSPSTSNATAAPATALTHKIKFKLDPSGSLELKPKDNGRSWLKRCSLALMV